jgi:DNA-binding PadR family transcriptional regulator
MSIYGESSEKLWNTNPLTNKKFSGTISLTDISVNDASITDISGATIVMKNTERNPEALLPLTPTVFHILLALADSERHGYGIMQEVLQRTDGAMHLGPGTLYGSIKRMLADGLIEPSGERPDPTLDDERRRYYRLTDFGQRVAFAEAQRLAQLVQIAQVKHLLPKPGIVGGA